MAKSKNHTSHNQSYTAHKNGVKKPKRHRHIPTKGVPPDGEYSVMYYRMTQGFKPHFRINAFIEEAGSLKLARQVIEMDNTRISILGKAFGLVDDYNQGFLNKEQCICHFEELNKYRYLPKTSREDFELIFDELDQSGDFKMS